MTLFGNYNFTFENARVVSLHAKNLHPADQNVRRARWLLRLARRREECMLGW